MGFSPDRRLRNAAEFNQVFAQPVKLKDRYFTVLSRKNDLMQSRLGLAISKRQLKRAVDRNRVKRLIRENFRAKIDQLPSIDIVVTASRNCFFADNPTLHQSLQMHFEKLLTSKIG